LLGRFFFAAGFFADFVDGRLLAVTPVSLTARLRGDLPPRTERASETIVLWPYCCVSLPKLRNFICYTQQLLRFQAKKTQPKRATQIRKRKGQREVGRSVAFCLDFFLALVSWFFFGWAALFGLSKARGGRKKTGKRHLRQLAKKSTCVAFLGGSRQGSSKTRENKLSTYQKNSPGTHFFGGGVLSVDFF
jgi:hypothetical protein